MERNLLTMTFSHISHKYKSRSTVHIRVDLQCMIKNCFLNFDIKRGEGVVETSY